MSDDNLQMPDTTAERTASSELDIYSEAMGPTVEDDFLRKNQLGLGNYSSSEYWQQVDSYQSGVYAAGAFQRRLRERAVAEAKREMAEKGWHVYDAEKEKTLKLPGWEDVDPDEKAEVESRRKWLEERGDQIWSSLTGDEQYQALVEIVGFEQDWTPPHWRMLEMRHESSRSRGARLIDNVFGRVKEVRDDTNDQLEKRRKRR